MALGAPHRSLDRFFLVVLGQTSIPIGGLPRFQQQEWALLIAALSISNALVPQALPPKPCPPNPSPGKRVKNNSTPDLPWPFPPHPVLDFGLHFFRLEIAKMKRVN